VGRARAPIDGDVVSGIMLRDNCRGLSPARRDKRDILPNVLGARAVYLLPPADVVACILVHARA
jgi:hypothetical protein